MIVDLNLKDKLVLVIGGGSEALKRINQLITQDCKILVVSEKINRQLSNYVKNKKIDFKKTKLTGTGFLSKYKPFLIMTTTDDKDLNKKIVKYAKKNGCNVYSSDDPISSDFSNLSIINIEDMVRVGISTGGQSPAMAKKLKIQAEKVFKKIIKKEDLFQIKLQQIARAEAKGKITGSRERKKFLYSVLSDSEIKQLIKDENLKKAHKRARQMLREWE